MLPYIQSLTGLRFIAASFIVLHHIMASSLFIPKGFGIGFNPQLGNAVTFFFCLSGFTLHYNYHQKIKTIPYWKFFLMRYLRVWPLHAVMFIVSIFLFYPEGTKSILNHLSRFELIQIFTLTQSLNPKEKVYYGVNGIAWFISTLVFLYASFPFISVGINRKPYTTIVVILSIIFTYLIIAKNIFYNQAITGNAVGLGSINPIPRLFDFTLGIATCEYLLRKGFINYKQKGINNAQQTIWTLLEISVFSIVPIAVYFSIHFVYHIFGHPVITSWLHGSLTSLFYCPLIALIAYEKGGISRLLSTKAFMWLGSISYAIYLVHNLLIGFWKRNIEPSPLPLSLQVLSFLVVLIAISACGYYFIELPIANKVRKFINKFGN